MSYQILEKQPGYVKELERVQSLQKDLYGALRVCKDCRSHLEVVKHCNTESVLELFGFYRRKCNNSTVLKCLGDFSFIFISLKFSENQSNPQFQTLFSSNWKKLVFQIRQLSIKELVFGTGNKN